MIQRDILKQLLSWKSQRVLKPLILRGARQTGKTYLARQLGTTFANYVEINCEKLAGIKDIFAKDLSIERIIRELKLITDQNIVPGETLLFFDEIQEIPEAIKALRYFYEEQPNLHVIAAGSLLDFTLENIGVPVGRVNFLYLYPISFLEFLNATQNQILAAEILKHELSEPLAEPIHKKILELLAIYLAVGGMPEAVQTWVDTQDINECNLVHHNLIESYRQDFQKYAKKFQVKYLDLLLNNIPPQISRKFKYSNISQEYRKRELMPCLELLVKAQIVHKITHSSGNGVPLGAEIDMEKFKVIFLDIALCQTVLGFNTKEWFLHPFNTLVNHGELIEAFVGQELLAYSDATSKANLYYWQREARGSSAEVDYLVAQNQKIIPIEVKGGVTGTMKSLKFFLQNKTNSPFGIRLSTQNYSQYENIKSFPLYAVAKAIMT